jgi:hypothetical protein
MFGFAVKIVSSTELFGIQLAFYTKVYVLCPFSVLGAYQQ